MPGNSEGHIPICEKGSSEGMWLPLAGDAEQDWPVPVRIALYFIGLSWCFMGVAIIADVFMGAIEKITSRKVTKKSHEFKDRNMTVLVWNPTVANLTLMALGSSAPEILLNVIELLGNNFYSGKLGPSTIVGSAAFNFLCIVAVCVSAIPDDEVRFIKELPVHAVTTIFSLFAYFWMVFVLLVRSKNVVEVWEGVVSFLCFPLLVFLAYLADQGLFSTSSPRLGECYVAGVVMSKEELAILEANIRRKHGYNLSDEQVAKFVEHTTIPTSRAMYRVAATRELTGGRRISVPKLQQVRQSVSGTVLPTVPKRPSKVTPVVEEELEDKYIEDPDEAIVEFKVERYAVLENAGKVELTVERRGNVNISSAVKYSAREGTAKFETDFKLEGGTLVFEPLETEKVITVDIVDDNAYEEDEEFFVDLMDELKPAHSKEPWTPATLGVKVSATVLIIDDDLPGIIGFPADTVEVQENENDKVVEFIVERKHGGTGKVGCSYHTEDDSAIAGIDYDKAEGTLEFSEGQMSAVIAVNIKAAGKYERKEMFRLILNGSFGGAKFDPHSDGGSDSCILSVYIASHQSAKERIDRLMSKLTVNWDKAKLGHANWREQFVEALYVNGGNDEEETPGMLDKVMHVIVLPWKLLFALVPPTDYCGGWACFFCSLAMIGVVTAVIGDMAKLFGCVMNVPDEVTAITFVALGTSLPDTFASKTAAVQDPFADASIGNVTGSNSVNVFLGLGLPWLIGSGYWSVKNQDFRVEAGALVPSVIIYCCCALVCVCILFVRRQAYGGELGGPRSTKWLTSFLLVCLWIIYVTLSSIFTLQERGN